MKERVKVTAVLVYVYLARVTTGEKNIRLEMRKRSMRRVMGRVRGEGMGRGTGALVRVRGGLSLFKPIRLGL